jgi:diguanylate cyclase (GGDEF)-like protein
MTVAPAPPQTPAAERCVAILDRGAAEGERLAAQLGHFGYLPRLFRQPAALQEFVEHIRPLAVLIQVAAPEEIDALSTLTRRISLAGLPLAVIADQGDLRTRLRALRAGGSAFFTRPLETDDLVDWLDALCSAATDEPYRVLVLADQPGDAALYARTLEADGLIPHILTDPESTLEAVRDFSPDVVLMDLQPATLSAGELTALLRQQAAHVSLPVIFVSADTAAAKRLQALRAGADDLIAKPVDPAQLLTSVRSRARRYRSLRALLQRDSLTGLLNHTKSKEFLEIEVARAKRDHTPLSFAMIDIDHFKQVNDRFGHAVGDRVIKALARLLQQRLRRSDIIGRYGGEEFAVILPNTAGPLAASVMDELRIAFSQLRHQAQGSEFAVTFSCGVAEYAPGLSASELAAGADAALYEAKHQGRNRVMLASPPSPP